MGEVAAMAEIHRQDSITGFEKGEINSHVRLATGMGLNIGMLSGEKTLRAFSSRPVNLKRFDKIDWMKTDEPLWAIADYLCEIKHTPLFNGSQPRMYMDKRLFEAGLVGRAE